MEDGNKNSSSVKKVVDLKPVGREDRFIRTKFGQFNTDDELLQSTARIKNQRDVIRERIEKMEVSKARVSQAVFEKVRRDYGLQLQTINDLLVEKKEILKKQIRELYVIREKTTMEIDRHREILEEASFRHFLNEFTEAQFHEVESFENKEVEKLEQDLAAIYSLLRMHEAVFDPEDLGMTPSPPPARAKAQASPTPETVTAVRETAPVPAVASAPPIHSRETVAIPATPARLTEEEVTPLPAPAPKPEAKDIEESPPTAAKAKTEVSEDDFAELFADEPGSETEALVQSQSNIKKILGDSETASAVAEPKADEDNLLADLPALDENPVEEVAPAEESDYFSKDKVNESSYNVAPPEKTDRIASPAPGSTPEVEKSFVTEVSSKKLSSPLPGAEDSISELLDSIHLDGEEPATAAASEKQAPAAVATTPQVATAAASGDSYRLTVLDGDLDQPYYNLADNTSIGRSPSNDVTLKAPKVSRQHAAINKYNNQYIIIDLKSSNGVFVNGAKIDEYVLKEGDEVSIGGYKFRFDKL